nr:hypothetical protein [Tanacetum cinerariifolium]
LTHTTKYISSALTQKVFANMRRVEVNVSDAAHEDDSAAHGEVTTVVEEQSIPSPTPPTPPPQPPQDIHLTSQVQQTPPQSPQRVETSDDTVMDDESNQGKMIAKMDQDDVVVLEDDKEEDREVADAVKDIEEAKTKEPIEEDENRALQKLDKTSAERASNRRNLNKEAEELRRHL